jgi:putative transposase
VVREIDKSTIEAAAWKEAVARERVIRELASADRPSRRDILRACSEHGLRRTRLYELLKAYRKRPVARTRVEIIWRSNYGPCTEVRLKA